MIVQFPKKKKKEEVLYYQIRLTAVTPSLDQTVLQENRVSDAVQSSKPIIYKSKKLPDYS